MELPAQPQLIELAEAPDGGFSLHVLASGSKGNAAIVEAGEQAVLVDCGITKKAFFERCADIGFDPARIQAVVVTHEHTDHTKGMGVVLRGLAKHGIRPAVHCTPGTLANSRELQGLRDAFDIHTVPDTAELLFGSIHAQFFPTSHDAAQPVGMAFEVATADGFDTLGYLTDSGVLPDAAVGLFQRARILALETNHDPKMLETGPYPYPLKQRIASNVGHLSNAQSADALERIAPAHLQAICGMHLSEENNRHRLAREALSAVPAGVAVAAAWQGMPFSITSGAE